ncbi:MAG: hypothetical protein L0I76_09615 [Pseudonocardia sp.]|nr:hypothetical protein [Pseudonocardia sp.]
MITYELQETRDVPGDGRRPVPGRVHGVRGVDDIRGIRRARSAPGRARVRGGRARVPARGAAFCPAPVALAPRALVSPAVFRMRRLVAGFGLALASAAAVFGLGMLADASFAANSAPTAPVTVLHGS